MKKAFIILAIIALSTGSVMAVEKEDLSLQYSKMRSLKAYYEAKVEQLVINMGIIEQRFIQIEKEKKSDEKPAQNPANTGR